MKAKKLLIFSLVVLTVAGLVGLASAGNPEKTGTAGAQELLIPVGARGTALGGACLASITGVDALYWNPAGIANTNQSVESSFSYMNYIADINITNLAVATKLGFGSLAFSFQSIGFGDIEQTTEDAPDGNGIMFSPTYFTLSGAFSRAMTDRIYAGVTVKMISEKIMGMGATAVAFDMGVQYLTGMGIKIGVAMKNYGSTITFSGGDTERLVYLPDTEPQTPPHRLAFPTQSAELPSMFELGVAYELKPVENASLTVMANFRNHNFGNDEYLGGAELVYNDMIFLRGGYSYENNQREYLGAKDYIYGPTFGAGFKYKLTGNTNIAVDFAYRTTDFFSNSTIFTVKLGF